MKLSRAYRKLRRGISFSLWNSGDDVKGDNVNHRSEILTEKHLDGGICNPEPETKWWSSVGKCRHAATAIKCGVYTVFAGSEQSITVTDLDKIDIVVSLNGNLPSGSYLKPLYIIDCLMQDYNVPKPETWRVIVDYFSTMMTEGRKLLIFCTGGHGRTGTLVASLIAKLEPDIDDPISALRERYCTEAVESFSQRQAIYEILGRPLPEKYNVPAMKVSFNNNYSAWDPATRTWKYDDNATSGTIYSHIASGRGERKDCQHECPCGNKWQHDVSAATTGCTYPEKDRDLCSRCFSKRTATGIIGALCEHTCPCGEIWKHDIPANTSACTLSEDGRDLCELCYKVKLSAVEKPMDGQIVLSEDAPNGFLCQHFCSSLSCGKAWSHFVESKDAPCALHGLCDSCLDKSSDPNDTFECWHECPCGNKWYHALPLKIISTDDLCTEDGFCCVSHRATKEEVGQCGV